MAELTIEQWKEIANGHLARNRKHIALLREIQEIAVNGEDENISKSEMREMLLDIFVKIMDHNINPTPPPKSPTDIGLME